MSNECVCPTANESNPWTFIRPFFEDVNGWLWGGKMSHFHGEPGTTSPLNFISTVCVVAVCGMNDAKKWWFPRFLTSLVTLPPFTSISRFPDPASLPSTNIKVKCC